MSVLYDHFDVVFSMTQRISDYCEIEIQIAESTMENILCLTFIETGSQAFAKFNIYKPSTATFNETQLNEQSVDEDGYFRTNSAADC